MDPLDYWRLCDELTIDQAALLIAGVDPTLYPQPESLPPDNRPVGFDAAKHAITNAVRREAIESEIIEFADINSFGERYGVIPGSIDPAVSRVTVDSLRAWLRNRGLKSGFFFPEGADKPDYLDKSHQRFAPKLAAAVQAWLAVEGAVERSGRSAKQTLVKWLRENAASLGLTDDEGKLNELGIEEVAKVANWQLTGGAPRTPGS